MTQIGKIIHIFWNRIMCWTYSLINKKGSHFDFLFAEKEGFEPPEVLPSTVFKTAAIDHSAISPMLGLSP